MHCVIDTNVWISAALTPSGVAAQVVEYVIANGKIVCSPETFEELKTRLMRPKFDRRLSLEIRRRILNSINGVAVWFEPSVLSTQHAYSRDPDDDKFIHLALAAKAQFLVSGDQDLLTVAPIEGLEILTPAQMLQKLTTEKSR